MNEFSDPPAHLVGEISDLPGVRRLLPQPPLETPPGMLPEALGPAVPPRIDSPSRRETGWYRDPAQARRHRYWTGERWFTQDEVFPELVDGPEPD